MELIFVKTEAYEEFEEQIQDCLKLVKHNTIKLLLTTLAFFVILCGLLITL